MIRSGDFFDFHFDRDNNSMRKGKIIVASMMVLCVLIFVAAAAWFMLFQGEMTEPTEEEKQAAILHAAGLMKSETQDKKSVETLYHRYIIQRHVNLDSGELVAGSSADTARQKCEKLAPERDPAQVRQRCTVADVFFVKDKNNEIQQVIIPVTGKGAKSMMHAFLALGLDGRTVRNLGTVAKLAMRQPFVLFKGLTFQKLCLPGAFRPGDHHNKMLRPGLCVVHASPQYL
nr:hypothetical protein [Escherichia coli]